MPEIKSVKLCEQCSMPFSVRLYSHYRQVYCSRRCYMLDRWAKKHEAQAAEQAGAVHKQMVGHARTRARARNT